VNREFISDDRIRASADQSETADRMHVRCRIATRPRFLLVVAVLTLAGCVTVRPAAQEVRRAGPPSDLALAWYRLANRWVAYAPPSRLREPADLAGRGCAVLHGEGTGERDVRGAAYLAFIYATLGAVGPYGETCGGKGVRYLLPERPEGCFAQKVPDTFSGGGVPREDLVDGAVRLIRWTGLTYPKWRRRWQAAMWAAIAGQAAWLIWDRLDDETRDLVREMVTGAADRFLGTQPPARLRRDTKAEENAWNSLVLVMAACLFRSDPRARRWDRKAREFMLSAYLRPADLASGRRVDGFALDSFAGANIFDDFSLENHGFFHPDYLACVSINMMNWLPYRLAGRRLPSSATCNVPRIVALLTRLSTPDGGVFYPSGQDWETLRRVMYAKVFAQAAVILGDADAAALERLSLTAAERLQARFDTGTFYAPAERRYMLAEELAASNCAWLFLFHTLAGAAPPAEREARLRGPVVLPDGRVAFNRTASAFASFSWGGRVMGYWTPMRADVEVPPRYDAFLGRVRITGQRKTIKRTVRAQARGAVSCRAAPSPPRGEGWGEGRDLAVVASIWRNDARSVRQDVAFVALGDGRVLYLERLLATKDATLTELATGVVYPPVARAGYRTVVDLAVEPAEAWTPYRGQWGAGVSANRLLGRRSFKTGETISRTAIMLRAAEASRVAARKLNLLPTESSDIMAVRDGKTLVVVNFGDRPAIVDLEAAPGVPTQVSVSPFDVFLWPPPGG